MSVASTRKRAGSAGTRDTNRFTPQKPRRCRQGCLRSSRAELQARMPALQSSLDLDTHPQRQWSIRVILNLDRVIASRRKIRQKVVDARLELGVLEQTQRSL